MTSVLLGVGSELAPASSAHSTIDPRAATNCAKVRLMSARSA